MTWLFFRKALCQDAHQKSEATRRRGRFLNPHSKPLIDQHHDYDSSKKLLQARHLQDAHQKSEALPLVCSSTVGATDFATSSISSYGMIPWEVIPESTETSERLSPEQRREKD
jgi:hypothetical protein